MLPEIIDKNNFQERILPAYQNVLEWLASFITDPTGHRYEMEKPYEQRLLEYGQQFERTKKILEFLDNPQDQFSSIHIAGTGGKGSVAMIIGKILQGPDTTIGIHTKPYLQTPLEKFLINGKMIAPSELINERLENLKFRGRMDLVQSEPTVILDGAHNPQKIAALAEAMRQQYADKKFTLIYGMFGHKGLPSSVTPLLDQAEKVIVVKPSVYGKPGMEIQKITEVIKSSGFQGKTFAIPEVKQAIEMVLKESSHDDIVLITGSLYMVGDAYGYWMKPEDLLFKAELGIL